MAAQALTKRAGYSKDALTEDISGLEPCEGWLKKMSHKGSWQNRYFVLRNGYLNYYSGKDKSKLLASINLAQCKSAEPEDMLLGNFSLLFADDSTYNLRASNGKDVSMWIDALTERIEYAVSTAKAGRGRGGRGDDDDDDDGGRRRRARRASDDDARDGKGGKGKSGESGRSGAGGVGLISGGGGGRRREGSDDDLPAAPPKRVQPNDPFKSKENGRAKGNAADSDDENAGGSNNRSKSAPGTGRKGGAGDSDDDGGSTAGKRRKGSDAASGARRGSDAGNAGAAGGRRAGAAASVADSDEDEDGGRGGAGARDNRRAGGGAGGQLGGGRGRRDRSESPPRPPPGPSMEGWVKKKARTKFGQFQARYVRLNDGILYFLENESTKEYSNVIDVSTITEVKPAASARSTQASERKAFIISTTFQPDVLLRATDERAVAQWVSTITAAIAHKKQYGKKPPQKRHNRRASGGSDDLDDGGRASGDDSDNDGLDSDADEDGAFGLPPPPSWYRDYERPDEARWMTATQKMLNRLFSDIYQKSDNGNNDGEEAGVGGDGDDRKVVISKLADSVTRACAELEDRVMELRMRNRSDVIKHMIQFFDLKFLNELTPLTTGTAPDKLSSKQLLQLIDCIEGFSSVRTKALGGITLSSTESRPGNMLRETRRLLINRYMSVMGPKLHAVAERVLEKLKKEKGELVTKTLGTRIGTKSPTDLFNLMSEHIKIAREGGSTNLQRRLLSAVMAEVVFYAREVLTELMDSWSKDPAAVDMDYVIAVINDAGLMLDHIEQLEAYFAEALAHNEEDIERSMSGKGKGGKKGGGSDPDMDELDREEAEQAREDLAAIEQDIPRAKGQLLNSGFQLTGVLVDVITADFKEPLALLFTSAWEKGNHVTVITATVADYLSESRLLLDPFFFDRLSSQVLAHLTEQYLLRLLAPESVRKDKGGEKKFDFKGGFGSRFKLNEDRLKKLVADTIEIGNAFAAFMPREDLTLVMASLNSVREMLTIDPETLITVLEVAMRNNPAVSTHIYLAFEKCVDLREDCNKNEKKALKEEGKKVLRDVGQPPNEDDDLLAMVAGGVMHGASMSQGMEWRPSHVTEALYKSLFPNAAKDSITLFAGWIPPVRSPLSPAGGGGGGGAGAGGAHSQEMSLAGFLGGGGGGGGLDSSTSASNSGGSGAGAAPGQGSSTLDMGSFLGDAGGGGGSIGRSNAASRRHAGDDDDDDRPAPSTNKKGGSSGFGGSKAAISNGKQRYNDDSDYGDGGGGGRSGGGSAGAGAVAVSSPQVDRDSFNAPVAPSFTSGNSNAAGGRAAGGGGRDRRRRGRGGDDDDDDEGGGGRRR